MLCWTRVNTCVKTSLGCLRKLGWFIKVLAGSESLPSQMLGWIRSMKPIEDLSATSDWVNPCIPILSADYTSTYLDCNYNSIYCICTFTATYLTPVVVLTALIGSQAELFSTKYQPVPSSQITQAIFPKAVWDEMWAWCHAIHFVLDLTASKDISMYCITPCRLPPWS